MRTFMAISSILLSATAAMAAPDPLLEKLIAGARAVPASSISFERTAKAVSQEKDAAAETRTRLDRWDGKQLVPVAINGKPPTPAELAEIKKATAGRPVAGYHRLADFLKGTAVRISDPQGRTVYRVTGLPKGSINVGKDISGELVGEAIVDTSGPQPFVSRFRAYLPKPLSFFMVAKLDSFEFVNEYRIGPGGRPALVRQIQAMTGSQMGKAGTTRTESIYTPLR